MSTKIEINAAAEIMKGHEIEPDKLRAIVEAMQMLVGPDDTSEEPVSHVKKQFSIILSDPTGRLSAEFFKSAGFDGFTGWVVQIPEDSSVFSAADRIHKAAYEFNTTKKGRMMPAKTMGDAIENIPAKHFKEQDVWIKTKVPVFVVTTDNQIPQEVRE